MGLEREILMERLQNLLAGKSSGSPKLEPLPLGGGSTSTFLLKQGLIPNFPLSQFSPIGSDEGPWNHSFRLEQ